MLAIISSEAFTYLALAVLVLAALFGYFKGRGAVSASGRSLAWTHIPLIAWVIVSLGPSVLAIAMYLGYKSGLIQPPPSGYRFSLFVAWLPAQFAVLNWGFVALYLVCRLWPDFGAQKSAMWLSVIAMLLPNILLFSTAGEMLSTARDAGQGIGIMEAMLILPIVAMFLPGPISGIFDAGYGIGPVISTLTAPIQFLGLIGWLIGQLIGRVTGGSR